jgi:hypothetical protein
MYDLMSSINARLKGTEPDEVEDGPKGVKSQGPFRLRVVTAGQQRRAAVRREATAKRKRNEGYRRKWMMNQLRIAVLRGQLQVVGALDFADPDFVISQDSALHHNVVKHLIKTYGSVEAAHEHYLEVVA